MRCFVGGLSVLGPGLPGWSASEPVLAGLAPWSFAEAAAPPPALLGPAERRRAGATVRFALAAALEATEGEDRAAIETVFASANGDGAVIGAMMAAMHEPGGAISPTQFHNSVHNAAAGYWHIAAGSTAPSLSLGGHDGAFAAGLLAAMSSVAAGAKPILLCAYDAPMPPPFDAVRRTDFAFAAAMVLRVRPEGARAELELAYREGAAPFAPSEGLDALAEGNAAARALPLLRALAGRRAAVLRLPYLDDAHLELRVAPC
ncbi:beta-ketoacyl synthase chain length factor [Roseococcus sp. SYP-B2431]|uniref:beta-ketoacyl synthase chain length factor n=1 Tax=Roseococcus sp. SYP-B2431 TaxID=2496640 RepID=UPI0013F42F49|nr:beta-ketoacyl synthase chain length factor [Roseococcus sp. SYP-B2431]